MEKERIKRLFVSNRLAPPDLIYCALEMDKNDIGKYPVFS